MGYGEEVRLEEADRSLKAFRILGRGPRSSGSKQFRVHAIGDGLILVDFNLRRDFDV